MFRDISDWIARNPPARHAGVAAADLAGDGTVAFVVAGAGGPTRVLRWVNGALRDAAPAAAAGRPAAAAAAGDFDGDGREELFLVAADPAAGPDRLLAARPGGRWDDLLGRPAGPPNRSAGHAAAAVDRRGTGRYGFAVAAGRRLRFWDLGPDGVPADLAAAVGLGPPAAGRGLWAGPLLSARTDLWVGTPAGPNLLFKNRGDGTFADAAAEVGLGGPDGGAGAAAVDAGDGRPGLAQISWDGPHRLWVRRPDGAFRDRASPALALPGPARAVVVADFDNDGREELFVHCHGEPNRLFRVQSTEYRVQNINPTSRVHSGSDSLLCTQYSVLSVVMLDPGPATLPDGLGAGAAAADIDGDGVLELMLAHAGPAARPLALFKCPANANGWVRVVPRTRFGAPARGAVVRLRAGGRDQVRVIDGGSGAGCQMEPTAHFGLGPDPRVESVTVTWPDGTRVTLAEVRAGRVVDVPYPGG